MTGQTWNENADGVQKEPNTRHGGKNLEGYYYKS